MMATRITALLALGLAAVSSQAQTLSQYLALRKQHGITQAVGIQAMEAFIGTRTMEVRGTVRGTIGIGGKTLLLVEKSDGSDLQVESEKPVDWLSGGNVVTRMLVRATRQSENGSLQAHLLGVAPDQEIARIEAQAARSRPAPKAANTPSRSASPLRGPIGKGAKSQAQTRNWNLPAHEAVPVYAGFIQSVNKRLSDRQAMQIAHGIIGFSVQYGVDARLIMAMVMVESGFNPEARSRAGAMGLGQLMPGTAAGMGISNAYDTYENLYGTVRYIRGHMERYTARTGDAFEGLVLALAAYNAGSGNVRKHGGVPPFRETQNYVRKVIGIYNRLSGQS